MRHYLLKNSKMADITIALPVETLEYNQDLE